MNFFFKFVIDLLNQLVDLGEKIVDDVIVDMVMSIMCNQS
jgi:hypothetical protein